jgi:hypothetical protein
MKVSCGVCQFSGASRDIPEPQTTNVDPARTNAVFVPNATPPVAVLTIPNVAVIFFPDNILFVDVYVLIDVDVLVNVYVLVDVDVLIDVDILIAFTLLRVCRSRDSESERGKDGKNNGNLP